MKQTFFIFVVLLFYSLSVNAQDLLVTTNRDTLNCKMGEMQNDFYPITFVTDKEEISGLIHKDSVLFFKKNVFRAIDNNRLRPWYPLVEIGFEAGGAYQFGKFRMEDDLTDKSETAAKTGFYLGTDLTHYVTKRIGYGLTYHYRSLLEGDIKYHYIGPIVTLRFLEKDKTSHLFLSISGGYGWMRQKNAPVQLYDLRPRIEMQANSLSGNVTIGYSFKLAKYVSLRMKASYHIAYPSFVRIENISYYASSTQTPLDIGDYCHNMNTINFTAGFSFHK